MNARIFLASAAFFFSGFAAIGCQTSWQRLMMLFTGGDITSSAIVITVFMLGLGLGNLAGGWIADRHHSVAALRIFILSELMVGVWALFSPWLYHELLCIRLGALTGVRVTGTLLVVLSLLPPTLLMGFSLPLLVRGLGPSIQDAPRLIGRLYGVNTLGAAAGAFMTTWMSFPTGGIPLACQVSAGASIACVLLILPFALHKSTSVRVADPRDISFKVQLDPVFTRMLLLYALSGFIGLGLEMVWFRALGVAIKSTVWTFGTLLGIYLFGIGTGSIIATRWSCHSANPMRVFVVSQGLLALLAGMLISLFLRLTPAWPVLNWLHDYLASYEPIDAASVFADPEGGASARLLTLYLFIPLLLMLPPTLLMGFSFPFLQQAAQTNLPMLGRRIGWLQAANILGCVAGVILVTCVLLPYFGGSGTLRLLMMVGMCMAVLGCSKIGRLMWPLAGLLICVFLPGNDELWARLHGTTAAQITQTEDASGLTLIKQEPQASDLGDGVVYVNGIGQSWLPYGGIHSILGALPALLHPRPERIAIIGLGSGDTAYSSGPRYETERIFCVEIIRGQIKALQKYHASYPSLSLGALLADDRVRHICTDGRRFLMTTTERFDIIQADALRPNSAGSGNLYSEEYFKLVRDRLRPHGFAVTWAPTDRVRNTFWHVFEHGLDLGTLLIGSPDPFKATAADLRRRLGHLEIRQHFRKAGIPIQDLLAPYVQLDFSTHLVTPEKARKGPIEINTDLFPRDEFHLPFKP